MEVKENTPTNSEFNIKELIERKGSSLKWAKKIDFRSLELAVVEDLVYKKGLPIVISNTTRPWQRDREMFSWDWLKKNYGNLQIRPRDNDTFLDIAGWTLAEYIDYIQKPPSHRDRRLYGKDIACPSQWKEFISSKLNDFWCKGQCDLMGQLLTELQAETLMIYVGTDDTSTPGHFDILGSLGHNIMVYADEGAYSLWFCVSTVDRDEAIKFWKKQTRGSLHNDNQWISPEVLATAPFTVYVIEQREGDFVLLPPECAHQVINKNGKSIKVAWNTIKYQSIQCSYNNALPLCRSLGKPEVYRVKATAYYSLINRVHAVEQGKANSDALLDEFPPLLSIVEDMIASEWIEVEGDEELDVEVLRFIDDDFPHQRTCDFCSCDIWNRCYHCNQCGKEGGYDICLSCVAQGRGCLHKDKLILMEYLSMKYIKQEFERGIDAYQKLLKANNRKKTKKRKHTEWTPTEDQKELSVGTIAYRLVKLYGQENKTEACHQCGKVQPYSQAVLVRCNKGVNKSRCDKQYCSKCLWNRYGQKLMDCLSNKTWICPLCEDNCNCTPCLEKKGINPVDFSLEKILESAMEDNYPFQSYVAPNIPCVSDFKPHLPHMHALKKRKMYGLSTPTSASPGATSRSPTVATEKDISKMTERQQIRYLMSIEKRHSSKSPTSSSDDSASDSNSDENSSPPSSPPRKEQKKEKDKDKEQEGSNTPTKPKETKSESRQEIKPEPRPVQSNGINIPRTSQIQNGASNPTHAPSTEVPSNPLTANGHSSNSKWDNWGRPDSNGSRPSEGINMDSTRLETNNPPSSSGWNTPVTGFMDHFSTLLVRNLSYLCAGTDLQDMFSVCGPIDQVTIPMDRNTGKMKGYGFVKFSKREDAERAMRELNLKILKDRVIELEWSMDKAQQRKDGKLVCYKCFGDGHFAKDCTVQAPQVPPQAPPHQAPLHQAPPQQAPPQRPFNEREEWERQRQSRDRDPMEYSSNKIHRGYICFKCGKEGHVANDCKEKRVYGPGFKGVICFKCGQGGHLASVCESNFRGCFICGEEGHIAVECKSDKTYTNGPQSQLNAYQNSVYSKPDSLYSKPLEPMYNKPPDAAWPVEPNKYRKVESQTSREPIIKDTMWDDRERDNDRERLRDRKVTGWDDREPRPEPPRLIDPRDPRNNYLNESRYDAYKRDYKEYTTAASERDRKPAWDERDPRPTDSRDLRNNYSDRYGNNSRDYSRYPPRSDDRYSADPYSNTRSYLPQDAKPASIPQSEYRQPEGSMNSVGMNGAVPPGPSYYGLQPMNQTYTYSQPVDPVYSMLPGQLPMQPMGVGQSMPQQLMPSSTPPLAMQSPTASTPKAEDPKRRNFKHHCTKIVVNRLSTYFNNGQISTKEDFKQLSRKITNSILDKEQSRGYQMDKDTDPKIKKYVDTYYQQYQALVSSFREKNRAKVEDWLQQAYSPTSATSY